MIGLGYDVFGFVLVIALETASFGVVYWLRSTVFWVVWVLFNVIPYDSGVFWLDDLVVLLWSGLLLGFVYGV